LSLLEGLFVPFFMFASFYYYFTLARSFNSTRLPSRWDLAAATLMSVKLIASSFVIDGEVPFIMASVHCCIGIGKDDRFSGVCQPPSSSLLWIRTLPSSIKREPFVPNNSNWNGLPNE